MRIRRLVDDMLETMYAAEGVGLAATQVDVHERVIVIDTSEARDDPLRADQPRADREQRGDDRSATKAASRCPRSTTRCRATPASRVRALDRAGETREFEAEGLLSVCVQHEMDHLLGKVFVEYLSPLKRNRIKTRC